MESINFENMFNFSTFNIDPSSSSIQDKTERVAFIVLGAAIIVAATALVIGVVAFSVSPVAGFGLIPLVVAGTLISWELYKNAQVPVPNPSTNSSSKNAHSEQETVEDWLKERTLGQIEDLNLKPGHTSGSLLAAVQTRRGKILSLYAKLPLYEIYQKEQYSPRLFFLSKPLPSNKFTEKMKELLNSEMTFEELTMVIELCFHLQQNSLCDSQGVSYQIPDKTLLLEAVKRGAKGADYTIILEKLRLNMLTALGLFNGEAGANYRNLLELCQDNNAQVRRKQPDLTQGLHSTDSCSSSSEECTDMMLKEELEIINTDYFHSPDYKAFFDIQVDPGHPASKKDKTTEKRVTFSLCVSTLHEACYNKSPEQALQGLLSNDFTTLVKAELSSKRLTFFGLKRVLDLYTLIQDKKLTDSNNVAYALPPSQLLTQAWKRVNKSTNLSDILRNFTPSQLWRFGMFSKDSDHQYYTLLQDLLPQFTRLKKLETKTNEEPAPLNKHLLSASQGQEDSKQDEISQKEALILKEGLALIRLHNQYQESPDKKAFFEEVS